MDLSLKWLSFIYFFFVDINECDIPGTFSQKCENTKGSYKCSCHEGYYMDPALQTCKTLLDKEPHLLFTNRHDLREIGLKTKHYCELVNGLRSAIALDFNYATKKLYWSDVAFEQIMSTDLNGEERQLLKDMKEEKW